MPLTSSKPEQQDDARVVLALRRWDDLWSIFFPFLQPTLLPPTTTPPSITSALLLERPRVRFQPPYDTAVVKDSRLYRMRPKSKGLSPMAELSPVVLTGLKEKSCVKRLIKSLDRAIWDAFQNHERIDVDGDILRIISLLKAGSNRAELVNYQRAYGETALMAAARAGSADLLLELLAKGANANLRTAHGMSAEDFAVVNGHGSIARFLQLYGEHCTAMNRP